MNSRLIQQNIDQVIAILNPALRFVNCHMVEFFTENLWERYVPSEIRAELQTEEDIEAGIRTFLREEQSKLPNLQKFLRLAEKSYLENMDGVILSRNKLFDCLGFELQGDECNLNIKEFMNAKKNHEVEVISELMASIITNLKPYQKNDVYIIDAGDGKGYLSSRMALQYGFKVLGVDASEVNTEGSQKRMSKLQRAWNGLKERTETINRGLVPPPRRAKRRNERASNVDQPSTELPPYKAVNCYITKETNFDSLIQENFNVGGDFFACLTGLHTCGNLAPVCLEAFANSERFMAVCNVGCCYHLISEKYNPTEDTETKNQCDYGFPMSSYLRSKEIVLGRNAKMLASQSIHRTRRKDSLDTQSLFYRALLEVIVQKNYPNLEESIKVGKLKKFPTFMEYLERCDEKCKLGLSNLDRDYVNGMLEQYESKRSLLTLFYLIRMSYAQIVETLILLDRLLYLKENGIEKSYLVRLFDPVTSPRCYGIVAIR